MQMKTNKRVRFATAAMIALAAASTAQAQQLLTNADFEAGPIGPGAPGWTTFNANETTGEQAHTQGGKSFKTYGPFFVADPPPGAGGVQSVPATAGLTYNLKGFVLTPTGDHVSGNNLGLLQMQFRANTDPNTAPLAVHTGEVNSSSPGDTWIPFDLTGVAPAGTTNINVFIGHIQIDGFGGGAVYFDDLALTQVVGPAESNWTATGSGGWLSASNWQGGLIPNSAGAVANFGGSITAPSTVTIAGAGATAGRVNFNNGSNSYTVDGPGALTLDVATGNAALNVALGTHAINAPLVVNDTTDVSIAAAGGLSLGGALTLNNGAQLRVASGGALTINSATVAGSAGAAVVANGGQVVANSNLGTGVDVNSVGGLVNLNATQRVRSVSATANGTVRLNDVATATVLRTSSLTVDAGSTLNLGDNGAVVEYTGASPAAAIRTALIAGETGNWAGTGITGTKAAADSRYAVGYAEASDIGSPTTFLGETGIDSTTVLVRVTLKGDVTLSGTVDFDDLVPLAQNYGGTGKVWSNGDVDYDGDVDFDDLVPLAQNYGASVSASEISAAFGADFGADWALAAALAPEPASMTAMIGLTTMLLRRRRA